MEKKLAKLFDYQKYESNPRLDKLIKGVEERYPMEIQALSDDELGNLNAAGNVDVTHLKEAMRFARQDRKNRPML